MQVIINPNAIERIIIRDKRKTNRFVYKQINTVSWLMQKLQFWKKVEPIYAFVYDDFLGNYITEEDVINNIPLNYHGYIFDYYIYDLKTKEVFYKPDITIYYVSGKDTEYTFDTMEELLLKYQPLIDSIPDKVTFN